LPRSCARASPPPVGPFGRPEPGEQVVLLVEDALDEGPSGGRDPLLAVSPGYGVALGGRSNGDRPPVAVGEAIPSRDENLSPSSSRLRSSIYSGRQSSSSSSNDCAARS